MWPPLRQVRIHEHQDGPTMGGMDDRRRPGYCGFCGAPAMQDGFGVTVTSAGHTGSLRLCASCIVTRPAADVLAEAIRQAEQRALARQVQREAEERARDPGQCRHRVACMVSGEFFDVPGERFCTRRAPAMRTATARNTTRCISRSLPQSGLANAELRLTAPETVTKLPYCLYGP